MDQSEPTGDPGTPAPPPPTGWAAPPPVQAGPAGFVYADVPNRAIAYIIDVILVGIVAAIVGAVLGSIGLSTGAFAPGTLNFEVNFVGLIVAAIVGAAISAAYFVYTWTSMRGTLGMKVLGMQIGNAGDGKTLTMDQAVRRWLVIAAPGILAQVLFVLPAIGTLLGLLAFGWFIYLLWTTYSSPTKQGFHDKFANTMVVKAARSAG
ncbi:MAG: RDD family protein [Chloroflexota bacterium]